MSTQASPHIIVPEAHPQVPGPPGVEGAHCWVAVQAIPHVPQLALSVSRSTHSPPPSDAVQFWKGLSQLQKFIEQVSLLGQGMPQPPQFWESLETLVHTLPPSGSGH